MHFVWSSFVFTIIAFLILYWLLNRYAFGPLFSVMEKRRELIKQQMDEAAQTRQQATQYVEEQKAALQQARKDAQDIIEQARQTSNSQTEQLLNQAKEESMRLKDEAARDIENEKNKAVAALRSEIGAVSVQIASKVLQKEVDANAQEQLVDNYLKDVGIRQ
ncbi:MULTISPECIES: F0F1 ATP synthase subunit B [Paenibacillus]|uniref:ATP synthase subunit b n=1 Tax=Paenibacillus bovis TaxID=1616788 RepID=A0A172ZLJ9_9BACL|nr:MULTISPECIES: F0F1 ATP synthase subunit B [Paenibacillus]ANF98521.1 ATP synthase F0 subunit B [Paenibacillus bovis]